jgi:uncharacterized membrane protein YjjP (DUF1212 family)
MSITMEAKSGKSDTASLLAFMFRLGQAYLACSEQTATVELILRRTASAYGVRRSRVVAFPTAVFISLHEGDDERVTLAEGPTQTLRLDQIADVYKLGEIAQRGEISAREGVERLSAILRRSARFGIVGGIFGHTILSIGLAIVLAPTLINLAAAGILGTVVGAIKAFNRNRPVLSVPLPVVASSMVSVLVFLAVKYNLPVDPLHTLVPPLVSFLPGGMLTLAMVELAYGDMVSGSSRLMTGFVQLLLLAFGLAAGAVLVGYGAGNLLDSSVPDKSILWAPWLGALVFGVGVYMHFSAPRNSLPWMLVVLLLAFAAQRSAANVIGEHVSGFFGMLVATPLGYLIQMRFKGPPAMVTFLPAFWLLVPGSLGLLSVTRVLSDRAAGIDGLIAVVFTITSLALGTLFGASLYKWLTERFGAWRLQIGRASSYLRRRRKR